MSGAGADFGYRNPLYAQSLDFAGSVVALPRSGGFLLRRPIGQSGKSDAMGTYPFLSCRDWSALDADLAELENVVSIVAVADPLAGLCKTDLAEAFPDHLVDFKTHYIVNLAQADYRPCAGHRRKARAARSLANVECAPANPLALREWLALYEVLKARHGISGIATFSRTAFERQFAIPGVRLFRAETDGQVSGMLLFFEAGNDVYYHLGAYSQRGYEAQVSYALFDHAIAWFREAGFTRLLLGSGAGVQARSGDGLGRFKRGWATDTLGGLLGGRVIDREAYLGLAGSRWSGSYFPAYRAPEDELAQPASAP